MSLSFSDFFEAQSRFSGLSHTDQILRAGWFVHYALNNDRFDTARIISLFREIHVAPPPVSVYLPRMADKRPPLLLKDRRGYFLEGRVRRDLDTSLGQHPNTVIVSGLLQKITSQVSDPIERLYLEETIRCYKAAAFRATIVMAWNLCFDHLRRWIFADPERLSTFNAALSARFPKLGLVVRTPDHLDDLKESMVIDVLQSGKLISKNVEQLLREKLRRRNSAAHPSTIKISQPQADDVVSDLIENVILALPITPAAAAA